MGRPLKRENFLLSGENIEPVPYRYTGCGLDGIYLLNGFTIEEDEDDKYVRVTDIEGLHRAIGRHIVTQRKALTPAEIRFLRNVMDLTQAELAQVIGNTSQSVARWEKGECNIPATAEKLFRAMFMASLLSNDELNELRLFLNSQLGKLDTLDEIRTVPAQFVLGLSWSEKLAA